MENFGLMSAPPEGRQPGYFRPASLVEALDLASQHGAHSRLLAGGQTLIPQLYDEAGEGLAVIDLAGVEALRGVRGDDGGLWIGAMTSYADLSRGAARERFPIFGEAFRQTANLQVRNRATVGGTLALGERTAELVVLLAALDGEVRIASRTGHRSAPIETFLHDPVGAGLRSGEVICGVRLPAPSAGERHGLAEFSRRRSGGRALALAAVRCRPAEARVVMASPDLAPTALSVELADGQPEALTVLRACKARLSATPMAPAAASWLLASVRDAMANAR